LNSLRLLQVFEAQLSKQNSTTRRHGSFPKIVIRPQSAITCQISRTLNKHMRMRISYNR